MKDLTNGMVIPWAVKNIYRVVYDEDSQRLDKAATEQARADKRKSRIASAKPYDEFVSEWEKQSPPAEILTYYGQYPHPGTKALEA